MRARLAVSVLVAAALATGCAEGDAKTKQEQPPEQVVAAVADALSRGDLRQIPTQTGEPGKDLPEILRGMQGIRPRITPGEARRIGKTLNFRLNVSWPLSSEWNYETKSTMTLGGDTWKLNWSPAMIHPSLTAENRMEATTGITARGNITGRNGIVLVQNEPALVLGINKGGTGASGDDSVRRVAALMGLDDGPLLERFRTAGPQEFVEAVSVRIDAVPKGFNDIPGAETRSVTLPAAKSPGFARSVLGSVGIASPAAVEQSQGAIAPGEYIGQSGLQQRFDQTLRGKGASKVYLMPRASATGSGKPTRDNLLADFPTMTGQSLTTTLDYDLQSSLEDALDDTKAPASGAVVDVKSGSLLAAANNKSTREAPNATAATFAPGTAALPVAYLALLRSGANPDAKVTCDRSTQVAGRTLDNPKDVERTGSMTLGQAAAYGCVTALARDSARLSETALDEAGASLGLINGHDLAFANALGSYPATPDPALRAPTMTGTDGVQASPLGLATVAASVKNQRTMVPWVVEANRPGPPPQVAQLARREADQLQEMMENSVRRGLASDFAGNLTGATYGEAEGRTWVVGYNSSVAVAIEVQATSSRAASTLRSAVTAAAVRGSR